MSARGAGKGRSSAARFADAGLVGAALLVAALFIGLFLTDVTHALQYDAPLG